MADLTQFDTRSAARIARVVQAVEREPQRAAPLTFDVAVAQPRQKSIKLGTYTGAWATNEFKTVTLRYSPLTVSAINLFLNLPSNGQRRCAVAKDGTAWHLIQWQQETAATVTTTATADVIVGVSLCEDSLTFSRSRVGVFFVGTAATLAISVTTCSTATS
jgi:hypothetical protein